MSRVEVRLRQSKAEIATAIASLIIFVSLAAFWVATSSALDAGTDFSMWVYFGGISALVMTPFALLAGAAAAPFGALICAAVAWRRGLSIRRSAAAGAVHFAMFVLPGVYLLARMLGAPIPKFLSAFEHICMYALWILGPIPFLISMWIGNDTVPVVSDMYLISSLLSSAALAVCVKTALRGVVINEQDAPMMGWLPRPTLSMQFIYFLVWTVIHGFLFFAPFNFIDDRAREVTLTNSVFAGAVISVELGVLAWMVIACRRLGR